MEKMLTPKEIGEALIDSLTGPESHDMERSVYLRFLESCAEALCDAHGSELGSAGCEESSTEPFLVSIRGNDSTPPGGGIFAKFDLEGELF